MPPATAEAASIAIRQLPLYVEPAPDEALVSWLLRLASRLGVSLSVLASEAFGIEHKGRRLLWWRRPSPWMLKRISDRTGVNVERLSDMTLQSWAPVYRDDEENERFSTKRFFFKAPEHRQLRFAICTECLKLDAVPYLRLSWTIGWMAVCPLHKTIMTTRCNICLAKLRTPRPAWTMPFSPLKCSRCKNELSSEHRLAEPAVLRLQEALLKGKREGFTALGGAGNFSWTEMVALADALIGTFSIDVKGKARLRSFRQFKADVNAPRGMPRGRYADLALFAWLIGGWPASSGAEVGGDMLGRWLSGKPNCGLPHHPGGNYNHPRNPGPLTIALPFHERLRELLETRGSSPELRHQSTN
jgi:hypothetical protein